MHPKVTILSSIFLLPWAVVHAARNGHCPIQGAVLPAPLSPSTHSAVTAAAATFQVVVAGMTAGLNGSAVSITVKSIHEDAPLFEFHHTPPQLDARGAQEVNGDSVYRIASITKLLTVLAVLKLDGVSLDDIVTDYLPELRDLNKQAETQEALSLVDWDDITLGALASHMSGIATGYDGDIANTEGMDFEAFGWPARSDHYLPGCGGLSGLQACTLGDFFGNFGRRPPVMAPFVGPVYSNIAFFILGLVVEKVSGKPFSQFTQEEIVGVLGMNHTSAEKPVDSLGVIPQGLYEKTWNASLGPGYPAGGYYSSTNDLVAFAEGILGNKVLSPARTRRWLKPWTSTASVGALVGAPWEIFRSTSVTQDQRLVEIYTKGGGLTGYYGNLGVVPDYDIVSVVMVSGDTSEISAGTVQLLQTEVVRRFLPALEAAGKDAARSAFVGTYTTGSNGTNSTLTLSLDEDDLGPGLAVKEIGVRGVNLTAAYLALTGQVAGTPVRLRLYPATSLNAMMNGTRSAWRGMFDVGSPEHIEQIDAAFPWPGASCSSWTAVDGIPYELQSNNLFVFNTETGLDGQLVARSLELPSYRVTLTREV